MSDTHAHTVAFVRDTMLPEKSPPSTAAGPIKWVMENLFSSVLNTILTLLSIYFLWTVLAGVLPWVWYGSWTAGSLRECREVIAAVGLEHGAACWSVIGERYLQLIYGFYPSDLYWRVNLSMVLMFVALAPILFSNLPRKMLWFSALYPFVAFWLFWGGSIWMPIVVLAGFVLSYLALEYLSKMIGSLVGVIAALLVPLIWWFLLAGPVTSGLNAILPISIEEVESAKFGGFMLSIIIGVTGIVLSLPIGVLLALGRQSDLMIVKAICVGFIEFIRGVPLITLLFVASTLLNYFLPPGTTFDIVLRVIIMVTLFASAYMAEVVRGGLAALPTGQYEAADALGLDYWKATRLITMPQALKISIPGIVSTFIGLFKDTTLVSIIGLLDPIGLTANIRADSNWNGIVWELYGFIALMFFVFCFSMSRYSMYLERKLKTGH